MESPTQSTSASSPASQSPLPISEKQNITTTQETTPQNGSGEEGQEFKTWRERVIRHFPDGSYEFGQMSVFMITIGKALEIHRACYSMMDTYNKTVKSLRTQSDIDKYFGALMIALKQLREEEHKLIREALTQLPKEFKL